MGIKLLGWWEGQLREEYQRRAGAITAI